MGFFHKKNKRKNKKKESTPAALTFSTSNDSSDRPRWSPGYSPSILQAHTNILHSVKVVATENVEVMTAESQRALLRQREAIRKQLFERHNNDTTEQQEQQPAMDTSQEILANGRVVPAFTTSLSADQASVPLSSVSSRCSWDDPDVDEFPRYVKRSPDRQKQAQQEPPPHVVKRLGAVQLAVDQMEQESLGSSSTANKVPNKSTPTRAQSLPKAATSARQQPAKKSFFSKSNSSPTVVVSPDNSRPMDERLTDDINITDDSYYHQQHDEIMGQQDRYDALVEGHVVSFSESEEEEDTYDRGTSTIDTSTFVSHGTHPQVSTVLAAAVVSCGTNVVKTAMDCGGGGNNDSREESTAGMMMLNKKRPLYFEESATQKFLRRIIRNGFVLLYLLAEEHETWAGRTVTMVVAKGTLHEPARLEWTTVAGGQTPVTATMAINLFEILAIDTDMPDDDDNGNTDMNCIFTITTETGAVHLFEATSAEERDRIVHGMRTLIARWAFHLVAGDSTATSELYYTHDHHTNGGQELPTLPNPQETMNLIAHQLLDE